MDDHELNIVGDTQHEKTLDSDSDATVTLTAGIKNAATSTSSSAEGRSKSTEVFVAQHCLDRQEKKFSLRNNFFLHLTKTAIHLFTR